MVEFRESNPDAYYIIKYKSNNSVYERGAFVNSKQQGKWTYFDALGNIFEIAHYTDNTLDGEQTFYNEDGSIECVYLWEMGVQMKEECPE